MKTRKRRKNCRGALMCVVGYFFFLCKSEAFCATLMKSLQLYSFSFMNWKIKKTRFRMMRFFFSSISGASVRAHVTSPHPKSELGLRAQLKASLIYTLFFGSIATLKDRLFIENLTTHENDGLSRQTGLGIFAGTRICR